jgi:hypothetical protein
LNGKNVAVGRRLMEDVLRRASPRLERRWYGRRIDEYCKA